MMAVPNGASCYICLDEGCDDEGKPLVRDCSCRGSAGFAHLSCIVEYAEQKSQQGQQDPTPPTKAFLAPWEMCPNCNQLYQNQLSLDLASAFVSFAEKAYNYPGNGKWDKIRFMAALQSKIRLSITVLSGNVGAKNDSNRKHKMLKTECEIIINKLLLIVDHTKEDLKMGKWVHMPQTSDEYQFYRLLCGTYEAPGFEALAMVLCFDMNEASTKRSMSYFLKARTIYSLLGMKDESRGIELCINTTKAQLALFGTGRNTLNICIFYIKKREIKERSKRKIRL